MKRMVEAFGEEKLISQWAQDPRCVVSAKVIYDRLRKGWGVEESLTTPKRAYPAERPATVPRTAEERAYATALYRAGWTFAEVAERYGVSTEAVRLWVRGATDGGAQPRWHRHPKGDREDT